MTLCCAGTVEIRAQYEFALANLIFWKMIPAGVKYICEIGTVVGIQIQQAAVCENCSSPCNSLMKFD